MAARQPFDLAQGPLLRTSLLRLAREEHVLLLTLHHIIADDWSLGILIRELGILYAAGCQGHTAELPSLPIQYADFALWQRQWLQGDALQRQLDYWRKCLGDEPPVLTLPTDHSRPAVQNYRGAMHHFSLPPALPRALAALGRHHEATLFMTSLAVFYALLYRYIGQADLCVGTPIASRNRAETEGLIGFFVNTLALRTDLADDPSFSELLERVKQTTLGAYAHQDLPFKRLVKALQPTHSLSHAPLFQVMFTLLNSSLEAVQLPGLTLEPLALDSATAKFDLTLFLSETKAGLCATLEYNIDLFEATTIERLAGHYQHLLEAVVAAPEIRLSQLPLLSAAERQQLLVEWNATQVAYPPSHSLVSLFEQQVTNSPDSMALVFADQALSYADLNRRANQLAHRLHELGVGPEVVVGICLERSLELVIALLAVLKAGGAYLPLDPDYPAERLTFMLADAAAPVLISSAELLERLPAGAARHLLLEVEASGLAAGPELNPISKVQPDQLAYLIYTSGSTGQPKGVAVSHAGIINRLQWMQQTYPINASDVILQKTPFSFDVSVWEFFWPLLTGARLLLARPAGHKDAAYLKQLIEAEEVSVLHFVPPMLQIFLQSLSQGDCPSLRQVICSGEALSLETTRAFFRCCGAQLYNLYGPTEASVDVTFWQCSADSELASVPIGRPIANTQTYILDTHLNPVPPGVAGELYLGGVGLARGYLGRPALTAERFLPNPFGAPGSRFYRTGDLTHYQADGNIEFLGRLDHQVKIRGFRIELGEIETALQTLPAVREAAVLAREDTPGEQRLVAYLLADDQASLTAGALRQELQKTLPEYMLPAAFVFLDALPLNANCKLDRCALPVPEISRTELGVTYLAPRSKTERRLAGIWQALLGIEQVSVQDNFFELGGHSLLITQLASRVRSELGTELPLRCYFEHPDIASLGIVIDSTCDSIHSDEAIPLRPLARETFRTKPMVRDRERRSNNVRHTENKT
ncbi:MAG: amino acid adenylation domain-containing protein [Candidatus Thiodiazotropha sp. (ex Lucinoma aequizonata)]|nr:amino acid adenylation domain-containing protein [Candidatus Thiodiazotropha sp. (ex Lucinoma aequizonata)]MCU7888969.1 amino acid adenylation domain-containing protein [Candidatus Thiodiazotropha sp. (ex Lucinoma aequizonata)]MCU7896046.1 amino acid adenylation domain-containing protein [Candidatus Thiodiazotropha sp. (ex Lucinoma aequizonata)]MCU7899889.1 amino acid adenylation domain-containing protein [Candidatus Thiodiazotropha sp. (ex Lucinoma aequizonata)]MCU7902150.1 amino acid adeny